MSKHLASYKLIGDTKRTFQVLHCHFVFRNVRILGALVFYRVANLPIEKVCIIKNFEKANFRDFKRLVLSLKINPHLILRVFDQTWDRNEFVIFLAGLKTISR